MADQAGQQNDDLQQRLMKKQRLEVHRQLILQQPKEKCPRCNSMETKFVYFNNQKETQPRYFCKACTGFWTKGGQLRNSPWAISLGGGLIMRPATSSLFTGGLYPQAPSNNIQAPQNVVGNATNSLRLSPLQPSVPNNIQSLHNVGNAPNSFTAAWQAPNQGSSQLQPSVHINIQPPHSVVPTLPNSIMPAWPSQNQSMTQLQPYEINNIQPVVNNLNPSEAARHAPNQGPAQSQPSVDNYIYQIGSSTGGSFSVGPSYVDWSTYFSGPAPDIDEPSTP